MTADTGVATGVLRVVVVDDQELYRRGITATLSQQDGLYLVAELTCDEDTLQSVIDAAANVVVMGELGGGWDLFASALQRCLPGIGLVVLLEQVTEEDIFYALRAGVSACQRTNVAPERLLAMVRGAARGDCLIQTGDVTGLLPSRRVLALERLAFDEPGDSARTCPLSEREMEILAGVAEGCSNKEIGRRCGISDQTVKNHLTAVLRKLGVSDRTEAVVHALRHRWLKLESLRVGSPAA